MLRSCRAPAAASSLTVTVLSEHLARPRGRGHTPFGSHTGAAGGAACGDLVRLSVAIEGDRIVDAGFDASGCGATLAAGSAAVALIEGQPLLEAARVGAEVIACELGGLSPAKRHAAELAADALHRALGAAARADAGIEPDAGRVLVAMSGGVDSAVAALLTGEGAVGVTLELWSAPEADGDRSCCSPQAVRAARTLAHEMGLPHLSIDLRAEFRAGVVEPWLADHAAGLTPNPCVRCNGELRLDGMLELAERLGAAALATGHYARVAEGLLRAAVDTAKDQTYMLAALDPDQLARLRFPLGELHKSEVRELAARAGLSVAGKADSQDLCFLAGTGREAFLARYGGLVDRPGPIVDPSGRVLGHHRGQHNFTVGQRRGLGVGGGEPLYVLAKDAAANAVVAGRRPQLDRRTVAVRDATLHRAAACVDAVKLRYRSRPLACHVRGELPAGRLELELAQPASAGAPGQLACLLSGELVVGHGTIAA
jgi:tRNA-specific 2-thiouridylase